MKQLHGFDLRIHDRDKRQQREKDQTIASPLIGSARRKPSPVCIHAKQCGRSVVIEHDGNVYACDHCVYPQYKLGNILSDTLPDMVAKSLRSGFGVTEETALPRWCKECEVLAACQGGCPKPSIRNNLL